MVRDFLQILHDGKSWLLCDIVVDIKVGEGLRGEFGERVVVVGSLFGDVAAAMGAIV